ncbi:MAG: PilZ domain-containing protein [Candidatus Baltobacteraceae bacterium]
MPTLTDAFMFEPSVIPEKKKTAAPPAKPVANKRNFFRVPLKIKIDVNAGLPVMIPAVLMDISGGGCQIVSRILVEAGAPVAYNLRRGDGKPDLRLCGVIGSRRYSEAEHLYRYGVRFEGLNDADREALLQQITALERRLIMHRRRETEAVQAAKKTPHPKTVERAAGKKKSASQARGAFRVAWPFQMTFKIPKIPGVHRATSLDISAGGMRIATDMILRSEWVLEVTFTMPAQVLEILEHSEPAAISPFFSRSTAPKKVVKQRPFAPITVHCVVVPGVQESRGRYVQGIAFKDADHLMKEEITRFVHAAQLSKRRLAV